MKVFILPLAIPFANIDVFQMENLMLMVDFGALLKFFPKEPDEISVKRH